MKNLVLLVLIANIAIATENIRPYNGVVTEKIGRLSLVQGMLLVRTDLNLDTYLRANCLQVFQQSHKILHLIKNNRNGLSSSQLSTLERRIVATSYAFKRLLYQLPPNFVTGKFNASSIEEIEQQWRERVYDAINGPTSRIQDGCVCPYPECEAPCNNDPSTEEENEAENAARRKRQNIPSNCTLTEDQLAEIAMYGDFNINQACSLYNLSFTAFSRSKRAWLDIGGKALQTIFGTATNDDISNLNTSLHTIKIRQNTILVRSEHLTNLVEHSFRFMNNLTSAIERNTNLFASLRNYIVISQLVEEVANIIRHLIAMSIEANTRKALLKKQLVPPILTDEQIRILIEEGEKSFINLKFPIPLNTLSRSNHSAFISILRAVPTADPNVYLIAVPFVRTDVEYFIYKLTPFPIKSKDGKLVIPEISPFIAASDTDVVELRNLDSCTHISETYICENNVAIKNNADTCELAIVRNNTQRAMQLCKYYEIVLSRGYYALSYPKYWLIYFNSTQIATLSCPHDRVGKIIKVNNFIKLNAPCTLKTESITFSTTETISVSINLNVTEFLPTFSTNATIEKIKKPDRNLHQLLNNELATIKQLNDNISIREVDWSIKTPYISNFVVIAIIAIVLIVLIFSYRKRIRRVKTVREQTTHLAIELEKLKSTSTKVNLGTYETPRERAPPPPVPKIITIKSNSVGTNLHHKSSHNKWLQSNYLQMDRPNKTHSSSEESEL